MPITNLSSERFSDALPLSQLLIYEAGKELKAEILVNKASLDKYLKIFG